MKQKSLFPLPPIRSVEPVIFSLQTDQDEIIRSILELHNDGRPFDLDVTYSIGAFYRSIDPPILRFERYPDRAVGISAIADSRRIPIRSNSIRSIMFDPPFIVKNPNRNNPRLGIIEKRFHGFRTAAIMFEYLRDTIADCFRVLDRLGILVVKCQNTVSGGRNYPSEFIIQDFAYENGFKFRDKFILYRRNVLIAPNNRRDRQKHARKNYTVFFVFQKPGPNSSGDMCLYHSIPYIGKKRRKG